MSYQRRTFTLPLQRPAAPASPSGAAAGGSGTAFAASHFASGASPAAHHTILAGGTSPPAANPAEAGLPSLSDAAASNRVTMFSPPPRSTSGGGGVGGAHNGMFVNNNNTSNTTTTSTAIASISTVVASSSSGEGARAIGTGAAGRSGSNSRSPPRSGNGFSLATVTSGADTVSTTPSHAGISSFGGVAAISAVGAQRPAQVTIPPVGVGAAATSNNSGPSGAARGGGARNPFTTPNGFLNSRPVGAGAGVEGEAPLPSLSPRRSAGGGSDTLVAIGNNSTNARTAIFTEDGEGGSGDVGPPSSIDIGGPPSTSPTAAAPPTAAVAVPAGGAAGHQQHASLFQLHQPIATTSPSHAHHGRSGGPAAGGPSLMNAVGAISTGAAGGHAAAYYQQQQQHAVNLSTGTSNSADGGGGLGGSSAAAGVGFGMGFGGAMTPIGESSFRNSSLYTLVAETPPGSAHAPQPAAPPPPPFVTTRGHAFGLALGGSAGPNPATNPATHASGAVSPSIPTASASNASNMASLASASASGVSHLHGALPALGRPYGLFGAGTPAASSSQHRERAGGGGVVHASSNHLHTAGGGSVVSSPPAHGGGGPSAIRMASFGGAAGTTTTTTTTAAITNATISSSLGLGGGRQAHPFPAGGTAAAPPSPTATARESTAGALQLNPFVASGGGAGKEGQAPSPSLHPTIPIPPNNGGTPTVATASAAVVGGPFDASSSHLVPYQPMALPMAGTSDGAAATGGGTIHQQFPYGGGGPRSDVSAHTFGTTISYSQYSASARGGGGHPHLLGAAAAHSSFNHRHHRQHGHRLRQQQHLPKGSIHTVGAADLVGAAFSSSASASGEDGTEWTEGDSKGSTSEAGDGGGNRNPLAPRARRGVTEEGEDGGEDGARRRKRRRRRETAEEGAAAEGAGKGPRRWWEALCCCCGIGSGAVDAESVSPRRKSDGVRVAKGSADDPALTVGCGASVRRVFISLRGLVVGVCCLLLLMMAAAVLAVTTQLADRDVWAADAAAVAAGGPSGGPNGDSDGSGALLAISLEKSRAASVTAAGVRALDAALTAPSAAVRRVARSVAAAGDGSGSGGSSTNSASSLMGPGEQYERQMLKMMRRLNGFIGRGGAAVPAASEPQGKAFAGHSSSALLNITYTNVLVERLLASRRVGGTAAEDLSVTVQPMSAGGGRNIPRRGNTMAAMEAAEGVCDLGLTIAAERAMAGGSASLGGGDGSAPPLLWLDSYISRLVGLTEELAAAGGDALASSAYYFASSSSSSSTSTASPLLPLPPLATLPFANWAGGAAAAGAAVRFADRSFMRCEGGLAMGGGGGTSTSVTVGAPRRFDCFAQTALTAVISAAFQLKSSGSSDPDAPQSPSSSSSSSSLSYVYASDVPPGSVTTRAFVFDATSGEAPRSSLRLGPRRGEKDAHDGAPFWLAAQKAVSGATSSTGSVVFSGGLSISEMIADEETSSPAGDQSAAPRRLRYPSVGFEAAASVRDTTTASGGGGGKKDPSLSIAATVPLSSSFAALLYGAVRGGALGPLFTGVGGASGDYGGGAFAALTDSKGYLVAAAALTTNSASSAFAGQPSLEPEGGWGDAVDGSNKGGHYSDPMNVVYVAGLTTAEGRARPDCVPAGRFANVSYAADIDGNGDGNAAKPFRFLCRRHMTNFRGFAPLAEVAASHPTLLAPPSSSRDSPLSTLVRLRNGETFVVSSAALSAFPTSSSGAGMVFGGAPAGSTPQTMVVGEGTAPRNLLLFVPSHAGAMVQSLGGGGGASAIADGAVVIADDNTDLTAYEDHSGSVMSNSHGSLYDGTSVNYYMYKNSRAMHAADDYDADEYRSHNREALASARNWGIVAAAAVLVFSFAVLFVLMTAVLRPFEALAAELFFAVRGGGGGAAQQGDRGASSGGSGRRGASTAATAGRQSPIALAIASGSPVPPSFPNSAAAFASRGRPQRPNGSPPPAGAVPPPPASSSVGFGGIHGFWFRLYEFALLGRGLAVLSVDIANARQFIPQSAFVDVDQFFNDDGDGDDGGLFDEEACVAANINGDDDDDEGDIFFDESGYLYSDINGPHSGVGASDSAVFAISVTNQPSAGARVIVSASAAGNLSRQDNTGAATGNGGDEDDDDDSEGDIDYSTTVGTDTDSAGGASNSRVVFSRSRSVTAGGGGGGRPSTLAVAQRAAAAANNASTSLFLSASVNPIGGAGAGGRGYGRTASLRPASSFGGGGLLKGEATPHGASLLPPGSSHHRNSNVPPSRGLGAGGGGGSGTALLCGSGIATRKVTILSINIAQFHSHLAHCALAATTFGSGGGGGPTNSSPHAHSASPAAVSGGAAFQRLMADVVSAVERAAKGHKGVTDGFSGDRFTVTFNAVSPAANHASAAAGCALAIVKAVSKISYASAAEQTNAAAAADSPVSAANNGGNVSTTCSRHRAGVVDGAAGGVAAKVDDAPSASVWGDVEGATMMSNATAGGGSAAFSSSQKRSSPAVVASNSYDTATAATSAFRPPLLHPMSPSRLQSGDDLASAPLSPEAVVGMLHAGGVIGGGGGRHSRSHRPSMLSGHAAAAPSNANDGGGGVGHSAPASDAGGSALRSGRPYRRRGGGHHHAAAIAAAPSPALALTAGIATGLAHVGLMGSGTMRRFTVLGHVAGAAAVLERVAKRYAAMSVEAKAAEAAAAAAHSNAHSGAPREVGGNANAAASPTPQHFGAPKGPLADQQPSPIKHSGAPKAAPLIPISPDSVVLLSQEAVLDAESFYECLYVDAIELPNALAHTANLYARGGAPLQLHQQQQQQAQQYVYCSAPFSKAPSAERGASLPSFSAHTAAAYPQIGVIPSSHQQQHNAQYSSAATASIPMALLSASDQLQHALPSLVPAVMPIYSSSVDSQQPTRGGSAARVGGGPFGKGGAHQHTYGNSHPHMASTTASAAGILGQALASGGGGGDVGVSTVDGSDEPAPPTIVDLVEDGNGACGPLPRQHNSTATTATTTNSVAGGSTRQLPPTPHNGVASNATNVFAHAGLLVSSTYTSACPSVAATPRIGCATAGRHSAAAQSPMLGPQASVFEKSTNSNTAALIHTAMPPPLYPFQRRFIAVLKAAKGGGAGSSASFHGGGGGLSAAGGGGGVGGGDGAEWMYALEETSRASKYTALNKAFLALMRSGTCGGHPHNNHHHLHPTDQQQQQQQYLQTPPPPPAAHAAADGTCPSLPLPALGGGQTAYCSAEELVVSGNVTPTAAKSSTLHSSPMGVMSSAAALPGLGNGGACTPAGGVDGAFSPFSAAAVNAGGAAGSSSAVHMAFQPFSREAAAVGGVGQDSVSFPSLAAPHSQQRAAMPIPPSPAHQHRIGTTAPPSPSRGGGGGAFGGPPYNSHLHLHPHRNSNSASTSIDELFAEGMAQLAIAVGGQGQRQSHAAGGGGNGNADGAKAIGIYADPAAYCERYVAALLHAVARGEGALFAAGSWGSSSVGGGGHHCHSSSPSTLPLLLPGNRYVNPMNGYYADCVLPLRTALFRPFHPPPQPQPQPPMMIHVAAGADAQPLVPARTVRSAFPSPTHHAQHSFHPAGGAAYGGQAGGAMGGSTSTILTGGTNNGGSSVVLLASSLSHQQQQQQSHGLPSVRSGSLSAMGLGASVRTVVASPAPVRGGGGGIG